MFHCLWDTVFPHPWIVFPWIKDIKFITNCLFLSLDSFGGKMGPRNTCQRSGGPLLEPGEGTYKALVILCPALQDFPKLLSTLFILYSEPLELIFILPASDFPAKTLWTTTFGFVSKFIYKVSAFWQISETVHRQPQIVTLVKFRRIISIRKTMGTLQSKKTRWQPAEDSLGLEVSPV